MNRLVAPRRRRSGRAHAAAAPVAILLTVLALGSHAGAAPEGTPVPVTRGGADRTAADRAKAGARPRTVREPIPIDPRLLDYRDLLARIEAGKDTAARAEETRARRTMIESVARLAELDQDLARLEAVLAEQRARLAALERELAGRRQTGLVIVLSGYPKEPGPGSMTVTLPDGEPIVTPIAELRRESLRRGGMILVFQGEVAAGAQALEIALAGERWPDGDVGRVTIDAPADHVTVLRLDLSGVRAEQGVSGIRASVRQETGTRTPSGG